MRQTDIIKRAKIYIESLANGVNPLDGTLIENDSVLNDARIIRCLFYVSDILNKVIANGGEIAKPQKIKRQPFMLTDEQIDNLAVSEDFRTVSEIAAEINRQIDAENMRKISAVKIADWLVEKGLLVVKERNGKKNKFPTEPAIEMGIISHHVNGPHSEYYVNSYSSNAQQFIFDNIEEIIDYIQK